MTLGEAKWIEVVNSFLVALCVSGLLAWPILRLLVALKSRQTVSQYLGESHQVKQGTPTMGGLIILAGLLAAMASKGLGWNSVAVVAGFGFIGFVDDFAVPRLLKGKRGLGWMPKLALEILALVLISRGMSQTWPNPWMVFIVLFAANAYNFADGLDGLAGGLALLIAPVFFVVAFREFGPLMAALVGAVIPFLFLNSPPAKVFMGDVGSLAIGSLFGICASTVWLDTLPKFYSGPNTLAVGNPLLWAERTAMVVLAIVMIAELVPVPLQIASVKLRKGKRLFPRTPIHHTFEFWGWPEAKITWSFLLVQLVCSLCAISVLALAYGGAFR